MKLRLRRRALADIAAVIDWYNQQAPELGVRFFQELENTLHRVAENPLLYAEIHGDIRRARLARFPYGVFFRLSEAVLYVVAVTHDARDPIVWQRRR